MENIKNIIQLTMMFIFMVSLISMFAGTIYMIWWKDMPYWGSSWYSCVSYCRSHK